MPIGHALMVLNQQLLLDYKYTGAFCIGLLGVIALRSGFSVDKKKSTATLLGLLAGILVWTGWIEFSFVWIAEKIGTLPLTENGTVVTKPEYLIMPSSLGLLGTFFLFYVFSYNKCQFFNWIQKQIGIKKSLKSKEKSKPIALVTFIETIMILWTFYLVLLTVYDSDIAGDKHPVTYITAFGSLLWSAYLIRTLVKIKKFDYAIRYAVPTVIIFWNFVEILGRWNVFKEIWIHPMEFWLELSLLTFVLITCIGYYFVSSYYVKTKFLVK
ncbi:hypothetical protein NBRC110019_01010 [Neptunitalea chrysea]|uniref:Uncharacterized protein n=2 Tax=Neptunitalea chrysea TaxID=1647581 RepID=A0A9W6B3H0_9FLAO|nr:hypothetical protein NBRC110019_01010 [Neptunitalea chrysea]